MNTATATLQIKSEGDTKSAKRNIGAPSISNLSVAERRLLWISWQHPKMSRRLRRLWAFRG